MKNTLKNPTPLRSFSAPGTKVPGNPPFYIRPTIFLEFRARNL